MLKMSEEEEKLKETPYSVPKNGNQESMRVVVDRRSAKKKLSENNSDLQSMTKEELLAVFTEEKNKRKSNSKKLILIVLGLIAFTLIISIFTSIQFVSYIGAFTGVFASTVALSQRQKQTTIELARYEDITIAGPLCEMLNAHDKQITQTVQLALTNLLPKLKASDGNLISSEQKKQLRKALSRSKGSVKAIDYSVFQIAILKAFEQIGGHDELELVSEIAKSPESGYASTVRQAAIDCLPYLQARVAGEKERQELLRASSFTDLPDGDLLRPAHSPGETSPAELLRPADPLSKE